MTIYWTSSEFESVLTTANSNMSHKLVFQNLIHRIKFAPTHDLDLIAKLRVIQVMQKISPDMMLGFRLTNIAFRTEQFILDASASAVTDGKKPINSRDIKFVWNCPGLAFA